MSKKIEELKKENASVEIRFHSTGTSKAELPHDVTLSHLLIIMRNFQHELHQQGPKGNNMLLGEPIQYELRPLESLGSYGAFGEEFDDLCEAKNMIATYNRCEDMFLKHYDNAYRMKNLAEKIDQVHGMYLNARLLIGQPEYAERCQEAQSKYKQVEIGQYGIGKFSKCVNRIFEDEREDEERWRNKRERWNKIEWRIGMVFVVMFLLHVRWRA